MSDEYVIQWRSTVNGRAGRGTRKFNREEGERLVEELNREYPRIQHELITAPMITAETGATGTEDAGEAEEEVNETGAVYRR